MANTIRVEGNFENCPGDRLGYIIEKYSNFEGTIQICEHVSGNGKINADPDIPLLIFHSEGDTKYIDVKKLQKYGTVLHCNYKWKHGKYFNYWAYDYLNRIDNYKIDLNTKNSFSEKFLCLNGRPDWHRYATLQFLVNTGLYEKGLISFLDRYGQFSNEIAYEKFVHKFPGNKEFITDLYQNQECIILDRSNEQIHKNDRSHDEYIYKDTSISLVTETYGDAKRGTFITEKSWKPIANSHFQIWIAQPGIVQAFRDFGFDMFDDFLDNSYDYVVDDISRFEHAVDSLNIALCNIKQLTGTKKTELQKRLNDNQKKYLAMTISEEEIKGWL